MPNAPATSQPQRCRWIRWMVAGLLLANLIAGSWLLIGIPLDAMLARRIQLGQTLAEVQAIVGQHRIAIQYKNANGDSGLVVDSRHHIKSLLDAPAEQWTGWRIIPRSGNFDAWPIHIHFAPSGRVDRIKRGSEIVEQ